MMGPANVGLLDRPGAENVPDVNAVKTWYDGQAIKERLIKVCQLDGATKGHGLPCRLKSPNFFSKSSFC